MALLHRAELRPSKIELVSSWAPAQPWFPGGSGGQITVTDVVGAFRLDDPAGEVGIETLLVGTGDGPVLQVPLTYRAAPLDGREAWFIGTMAHSVLGERWVYDALGDPVYLLATAHAIVAGGQQAELFVDVDGEQVRRDPTALVRGSGTGGAPVTPMEVRAVSVRHAQGWTFVVAGDLRLEVARTLGDQDGPEPAGAVLGTLTGTWSGQDEPRLLVRMTAGADEGVGLKVGVQTPRPG